MLFSYAIENVYFYRIVKPQTSKTTRTRNSSDQPIFDLDKGESSEDETDSRK